MYGTRSRNTQAGRQTTLVLACVIAALCALSACRSVITPISTGSNIAGTINVVAAESFYGNILQQIGGSHVNVTSILSDPNVDPHEYEPNYKNAMSVAKANLVIDNGDGYDAWMDKLLSASPNSNRILLQGFNIAKTHLPDNEHVWYSIDNIQDIAQAMDNSLKKLDPANATSFDHNFQTFKTSLDQIRQKENAIKAQYAGTAVGLTESIYEYQAIPMGLRVLTPASFQQAMAEGNDPPANTVITAEKQINNRQIKTLIYNEQTISPITTRLQNDAQAHDIPITPVTETMPPDKTYQTWMLGQLDTLALNLGGK